MKLLENMENLGGSITDALKAMIEEMFNKELDEEEIDAIVDGLKLSDILILDQAYTKGDKDTVADIIGRDLVEYSMGRTATSAAAARPQPGRAQAGQQQKKQPGTQNTVQTNRNYSGGVQNGVSTTNIDNEDDPDQVMQDPVPVEEDSMSGEDYDMRARDIRNLGVGQYRVTVANKNHTQQDPIQAPAIKMYDKLVGLGYDKAAADWQAYVDSGAVEELKNSMSKREVESALRDMAEKYQGALAGMYDMEDPSDIAASMEELAAKYGLNIDDYLENPNESITENNVVDMVAWLKRRAGIE